MVTPEEYKKLHYCDKCRAASETALQQVDNIRATGDEPSPQLLAASLTECDAVCEEVYKISREESVALDQKKLIIEEITGYQGLQTVCSDFVAVSKLLKKAVRTTLKIRAGESLGNLKEFALEIISKKIDVLEGRVKECEVLVRKYETRAYAFKDVDDFEVEETNKQLKIHVNRLIKINTELKNFTDMRTALLSSTGGAGKSPILAMLAKYRSSQRMIKKGRALKLQRFSSCATLNCSSIPAIEEQLSKNIVSLQKQKETLQLKADGYAAAARKLRNNYWCVMIEGGSLVDIQEPVLYESEDMTRGDDKEFVTMVQNMRKRKNVGRHYRKKLVSDLNKHKTWVEDLVNSEIAVNQQVTSHMIDAKRKKILNEKLTAIRGKRRSLIKDLDAIHEQICIHEGMDGSMASIRTDKSKYEGSLKYSEDGEVDESSFLLEADEDAGGLKVVDGFTGISGWSASITDKPTREDVLQVLDFLVSVVDKTKGVSSKEIGTNTKGLRWYLAGFFLNCDKPKFLNSKIGQEAGYTEQQLKAVFGSFKKDIIECLKDRGVSPQYAKKIVNARKVHSRSIKRYLAVVKELLSAPLTQTGSKVKLTEKEIGKCLGSVTEDYREEIKVLKKVLWPLLPVNQQMLAKRKAKQAKGLKNGVTVKVNQSSYRTYRTLITGLQTLQNTRRKTYKGEILGAIRRYEISAYLGALVENVVENQGLSVKELGALEKIWKYKIEANIERWISEEYVRLSSMQECSYSDIVFKDENDEELGWVDAAQLRKKRQVNSGQSIKLIPRADLQKVNKERQEAKLKKAITNMIKGYKLKRKLREWIESEHGNKNKYGNKTLIVRRIKIVTHLEKWLSSDEKAGFDYQGFKTAWLGAAHVDLGIGDESELRALYKNVLEITEERKRAEEDKRLVKKHEEIERLRKEAERLQEGLVWLQANNYNWTLYHELF